MGDSDQALGDTVFPNVPERFRSQDLTVGSRALGEICYSIEFMPDGTVCNPAYLPDLPESLLLARVFMWNGYAALNSADQFLNKPLTKDYLQSLFQNQNASAVEANAQLSFSTRYFQASFSPYRVEYASEVHNPNDPEVAVNAAIEQSLVFATGTSLLSLSPDIRNFSVGVQLKLVQRKFVHGSFTLLDVATRETSDYLPVKQQSVALVDSSLAWIPRKNSWHLRMSIGLKNLGFSSANYGEYPDYTDLVGGIGIEPPVPVGRFRVGVDFTDLVHAAQIQDRFRLGTSYRYGLIELMAGRNSFASTIGISFLLSFIQASLVYEVDRNDLENGKQETRIATEFSARF